MCLPQERQMVRVSTAKVVPRFKEEAAPIYDTIPSQLYPTMLPTSAGYTKQNINDKAEEEIKEDVPVQVQPEPIYAAVDLKHKHAQRAKFRNTSAENFKCAANGRNRPKSLQAIKSEYEEVFSKILYYT